MVNVEFLPNQSRMFARRGLSLDDLNMTWFVCPLFLTHSLSFLLSRLQCNNDYAPVCGSNNQNYQNECFLRRDACKQQSEVLIMSEGACPAGMYILWRLRNRTHSSAQPPRSTDIHTQTKLWEYERLKDGGITDTVVCNQTNAMQQWYIKPEMQTVLDLLVRISDLNVVSVNICKCFHWMGFSNYGVMRCFKGNTNMMKELLEVTDVDVFSSKHD